jgi:hypothetical protein
MVVVKDLMGCGASLESHHEHRLDARAFTGRGPDVDGFYGNPFGE